MNTAEANQKLFDLALNHIREQGEPSFKYDYPDNPDPHNIACLYKNGPVGCAFAPAIKKYHPKLESRSADTLMNPAKLFKVSGLEKGKDYDLHDWVYDAESDVAVVIQEAHDNNCTKDDFVDCFNRDMQTIANDYDLVYTDPE